MSIVVLQQPERVTPSNLEMIYTLSSSNKYLTNFKYVLDVYELKGEMYPLADESVKIGRLKVRPNKEGNCIVDIQQIVADTLQPNIQKDYEEPIGQQYFSMFVGGNSGYDSFFVTKPTIFLGYSQINGNNHITDFEEKIHLAEYRVLVGEEYDNIDGTKTLIVPDEPNKPETSFRTSGNQDVVIGVAADTPSVNWNNAGLVYPTGANSGVEWIIYTDQTETTIAEGPTSTDDKFGTVTPTTTMGGGYILQIKERYSNLTKIWVWNSAPGEGLGNVIGWEFFSTLYPQPFGNLDSIFSPVSFFSWVSSVRDEDRYQRQDMIGDTSTSDENYMGRGNHLFNWYPYRIGKVGRSFNGFLSPMPYTVETNDTFPYNGGYAGYTKNFYKKWYPGQPIMFGFFNSYLHEFSNQVRAISRMILFKNGTRESIIIYNTKANGGGPLINFDDAYPDPDIQETENRITHFTDNQVNTKYYLDENNGGIDQIYYYLITDIQLLNNDTWENNGNTPYFRFDRQDLGCFEKEPINFVYLNPLGGWDTLTFGKKNIKTYSITRKDFDKSKYIQGQYYNRLSFEEKTRIYDQSTKVSVSASSDYVDEGDSKYIEDLILSPYTYIVTNTIGNGGDNISSNPELIPINITNKSVEEYKKQYEKLKQYTINFEYDNIEGYRVQL